MNDHLGPDIHALSGAYAVDALDDLERASFEGHLAECSACREEVASLTEAAGLLGAAAGTMPPAGLRDLVLADIAKVRPLPPLPAQLPNQLPKQLPADDSAPLHATDELAARREVVRRRRLPRLPRLLAAAAAIIAVGAGVTVAQQPWDDGAGQISAVADQVLNAPDATELEQSVNGGNATLVRSESVGRAVLVTQGLPSLPSNRVYELWFQDAEGTVVSAGLMPGTGDQTFLLEGDATAAIWAGITVEPKGGSDVPTMPTIASFDLKGTV